MAANHSPQSKKKPSSLAKIWLPAVCCRCLHARARYYMCRGVAPQLACCTHFRAVELFLSSACAPFRAVGCIPALHVHLIRAVELLLSSACAPVSCRGAASQLCVSHLVFVFVSQHQEVAGGVDAGSALSTTTTHRAPASLRALRPRRSLDVCTRACGVWW